MKFTKLKAVFAAALCAVAGAFAYAGDAPKSNYTEKELAYMSATELRAKFKTCEIKPSEVLKAQISRVER